MFALIREIFAECRILSIQVSNMLIKLARVSFQLSSSSASINAGCRISPVIMNPSVRLVSQWQDAVEGLDPKQVQFYHSEKIIRVDEDDKVVGSISKGEAHAIETVKKSIYHRALSLLIFDKQDRFLLTQRAVSKITFPNYYTNACCSHPLYNERELEEDGNAIGVRRAVIRRSNYELGIKTSDIKINELKFMNRILYRAESDGGIWGEAEIDYIFILHKDIELKANPEEVQSYQYVTRDQMHELLEDSQSNRVKVTPWVKLLAKKFLFKYWDNLDSLDEIAEPQSIVAFKDLCPST